MSQLHPVTHPESKDLQLLSEISQLLTMLDLDRVLQTVIDLAAKSVGAAKTSLFLHDGTDIDWEHIVVTRDLSSDQSIAVVRRVMDTGLAGWVSRNREGAIIEDTFNDDRWHVFPDDKYPVRSALCVPFLHLDRVLAILTLVHPEPNHFTRHHLMVMTIIANQASVAIHNAQLFYRVQALLRQLEIMLKAIPDALFIMDDKGEIILVNQSAGELLGIEPEEAEGRTITEFAEIDSSLVPVREIATEPIKSGEQWSFDVRSEQHKRDFLVTMSVWEKPSQIITKMGYVAVMHDITRLRDLSRFKDTMMSIASHDLRTPLSLIVGYCDLIGLDVAPDSPTAQYLEVIRRSTNRMNTMLDDLLRVEQLRSSPLELHEQVAMGDLVTKVMDNLQPVAGRKKHQLELDSDLAVLPRLIVDPIMVREAMENYITNAIKYTPEGGHITVQAYVSTFDGDGDAGGERFNYVVQDNGLGIPEQYIHRLFDSFFRAKQPGTEKIEGTGLGLSLVKTVVERHNGEVWVETQSGVGSRFGFWLPIRKQGE